MHCLAHCAWLLTEAAAFDLSLSKWDPPVHNRVTCYREAQGPGVFQSVMWMFLLARPETDPPCLVENICCVQSKKVCFCVGRSWQQRHPLIPCPRRRSSDTRPRARQLWRRTCACRTASSTLPPSLSTSTAHSHGQCSFFSDSTLR